MTTPQHDPHGPYGSAAPSYPAAPQPDGRGYDPYAQQAGPWTSGGAPYPGALVPGGKGGPPRRRRSNAPLAVVAALALAIGVAAVGWFVWPAWGDAGADPTTTGPTPTATAPSPTADPATQDPTDDPTSDDPTQDPTDDRQQAEPAGGEIVDGQMNGPGYSYTVPAGWVLAADSGDSDDGTVEDGAASDITVWNFGSDLGYCQADIEALQIWVPGTLAELPDREIGGAPATGGSLTGDDGDYYEIYCVDVDGVAFEVSLHTTVSAADDVLPLWADVLDSWEWE